MGRQPRSLRLLAILVALSLVAAACGDDDDDGGTEAEQASGGELLLGAEQWPECLNPVTQCSNAAWLTWSVTQYLLPKLMELDPNNEFVAGPLLAGEPELSGEGTDNGDGPFTVTYTLNEDAVWEDGSPITSSDVKFTWQARLETTGTVSTVGYEDIESVDDSDPQVAVVTWKRPYAAWATVMGLNGDGLLKAEAFDGNTDLADEMQDEIPFSGGPFILDSWSTDEATFVRNDEYWDDERVPLVDSVKFLPLEDTETEVAALRSGQVHAITPQPAPGLTDEIGDMESKLGFSSQFEHLWFNQSSLLNPDSVLKDPAVREALLYAIDRQKLLEEVVQPDIPEAELLNCGGWVPTIGEWCDVSDFEDVTYDPDKAQSILEDAGWAKGDDGIYAKDGQKLSMTWQTVADNQRRLDTQAIVIPDLKEFGIEVKADNYDAGTLFEQRLPQLQSEMMMYAWVTGPDPRTSDWASCEQIPSEANDFSGQNNIGWCNEEATDLMFQADEAVDEAERLDLTQQVGDMMREDAISLPLWQLPILTVWDPEAIEGPIAEWNATAYQGFWNLYDWSLAG